MKSLSVRLLATPWIAAYQAPPSMAFSRQECWSGVPLPSPKESWAPNNWCFWTMVLEKTLESPLDCKEIQPVHPKGNQFWIFIGRTDVGAETPILWPPDENRKDARKDWRREEKGMTEDEMVGWHHWLNGLWVWVASRSWWSTGRPGVLQSMGSQRLDIIEQLNWTELTWEH